MCLQKRSFCTQIFDLQAKLCKQIVDLQPNRPAAWRSNTLICVQTLRVCKQAERQAVQPPGCAPCTAFTASLAKPPVLQAKLCVQTRSRYACKSKICSKSFAKVRTASLANLRFAYKSVAFVSRWFVSKGQCERSLAPRTLTKA